MPQPGTEFNPLFQEFLFWSIIVTAIVVVWMMAALILYRHKPGTPKPKDHPKAGYFPYHRGSVKLELAWTIAPTILIIWLTYVSLGPLDILWGEAPEDSIEIEVEGSQWVWKVTYPDGETAFNELRVKCDQPYKLILSSTDVLHAFWIPDYGVKEDAVPGQDTIMWFQPTKAGEFPIRCAEYCGYSHAYMLATLIVEGPCGSE